LNEERKIEPVHKDILECVLKKKQKEQLDKKR